MKKMLLALIATGLSFNIYAQQSTFARNVNEFVDTLKKTDLAMGIGYGSINPGSNSLTAYNGYFESRYRMQALSDINPALSTSTRIQIAYGSESEAFAGGGMNTDYMSFGINQKIRHDIQMGKNIVVAPYLGAGLAYYRYSIEDEMIFMGQNFGTTSATESGLSVQPELGFDIEFQRQHRGFVAMGMLYNTGGLDNISFSNIGYAYLF